MTGGCDVAATRRAEDRSVGSRPARVNPGRGSDALESAWCPPAALDVAATLGALQRGRGDPTQRISPDGTVWRTVPAPTGPATLALRRRGGEVLARAWGPGAEWALAGVPALLGADDEPESFLARHGVLREAVRRFPGVRIPRTRRVFDQLVPAVLEQKVTGVEARRSWRELIRRFGSLAPGPAPVGMRVAPYAATYARLPVWEWHRAGVDFPRRRALQGAAVVAARLEECAGLPAADALRRLQVVPGIGPWTAAEVAQRALGDADAVSVGDYHIPAMVGWALIGRPVDDDGMLELLEPYRGHRHRVVRLLELARPAKPRFGARMPARDYRAF